MKKVLILGSAGMLGHIVYLYFKSLHEYIIIDTSYPFKFNENSFLLDVSKQDELENFISAQQPEIVINCIGILIKGSLSNPSNAIYLNAYLPHKLASILKPAGAKLIHISTDCVFSGNKGAYSENDFKDARDIYGLSKALGEVDYGNHLTLRTSIVGPEIKETGEGLFDWFMKQKGSINGYTKSFWGGVTTLELAKTIHYSLENNISGLVHVTNNIPISKYLLINLFKEVFGKTDVSLIEAPDYATDKSLLTTRKDFSYIVPDYRQMILEMHAFMLNKKELYQKYFLEQK